MFLQPHLSAASQSQVGGVLMVQTPCTHRLTHTHVHTGCGCLCLTQTSVGAVCPKGVPFSETCHPGPRTEPESPEIVIHSFGKPQVAVVDPGLEPDSWKGPVLVVAGRPGSGVARAELSFPVPPSLGLEWELSPPGPQPSILPAEAKHLEPCGRLRGFSRVCFCLVPPLTRNHFHPQRHAAPPQRPAQRGHV